MKKAAVVTTAVIYLQILIGATMRHTEAGLAIPDFPLAFGRLIPPVWDAKIAIHFAHRVGALVVTAAILVTTFQVFRRFRGHRELRNPAILLIDLLMAQITLGALTVLTGKQFIINSLHVVTGAFVLGTSLVLALRAWRPRIARSEDVAAGSKDPAYRNVADLRRAGLQTRRERLQTRREARA